MSAVHYLRHGLPVCGFSNAVPREWPPGHTWSDRRKDITCPGCKTVVVEPPMDRFAMGSVEWPGLAKLTEEAAEVIQVGAKLIATRGNVQHWDGTDLRTRLTEELADLRAAILFFIEMNPVDTAALDLRTKRKLERFRKWHKDRT